MGQISTRRSRLKGDSIIVPTFRSAQATKIINLQELVHAGTKGGRQRLQGVKDWNGTWEEYGFVPSFWPGDEISYVGSIDGVKGYAGEAIVTQVVITIPVGAGTAPTISGTFRGIGELDLSDSTAVALPTVADVDIPSVHGLCVLLAALSDSPSYVAQAGTNEITITLSIEALEVNNCSTSGVMDAIEGLWDATISYKRYVDDTATIPEPGTPYHVRIPIDIAGTEYYQFEYMRVGDISDITLNRETGEVLNVTIPLSMSMIETIGATVTVGSGVTKPDTNVWRPDET